MLKFEGGGKKSANAGVYLKVQDLGDSLHHLILIVGVILLTPCAGMVCSQVQSGGNENEHLGFAGSRGGISGSSS